MELNTHEIAEAGEFEGEVYVHTPNNTSEFRKKTIACLGRLGFKVSDDDFQANDINQEEK